MRMRAMCERLELALCLEEWVTEEKRTEEIYVLGYRYAACLPLSWAYHCSSGGGCDPERSRLSNNRYVSTFQTIVLLALTTMQRVRV